MISRASAGRIVISFDKTTIELTLQAAFSLQARRYPDRSAIVTETDECSYGQLDRFSNQFANKLLARDQRPGDTVGVFLEQGIAQIAAILGVLKAGGIYVPLDSRLTRAQLRKIVINADLKLILTDKINRSTAKLIAAAHHPVLNVEQDIAQSSEVLAPHAGSPDDYAYIYFTSGSTGEAKGVVDNHRNILHNIWRYTNSLAIDCEDRLTLLQSCGFSGAVSNIFGALVNGATLLPFDIRSRSVKELALWLAEQQATIYHSVPSLFRQIADSDVALPSLRIVRLEGDTARAGDVDAFNRQFDSRCTLVNGLGATETGIAAQHFIAHGTVTQDATVPVGKSTEDLQIEIVNGRGVPLPQGQIGEIVVTGPYLACAYWNKPELTDAAFSTGDSEMRTYRTGDLGRLNAEGLLELHGRADLLIKVSGEWVDLRALESALSGVAGVKDAIAAFLPDQNENPLLITWVVREPGSTLSTAELRDGLWTQGITGNAMPARFVTIDHWPLDANGKVDRKSLASIVVNRPVGVPPRTPTEVLVAEIFQQVLRLPSVTTSDDFFELGGDSLKAVEACLALEKMTGSRLSLGAFQHGSSIEALARFLDRKAQPQSLVPLQPLGTGPAIFCVHAHGGHVFNLRELALQLAPEQKFFGLQAKGLDGMEPAETEVETMAADYVASLQKEQPAGPYLIAGYCFGSWIAVEVARLLRDQGEKIDALLLIDPNLPPGIVRRDSLFIGARWLNIAKQIRRATPESAMCMARNLCRPFGSTLRIRILSWASRVKPLKTSLLRNPADAIGVMSIAYRARPYEGDAIVLIPANMTLDERQKAGWKKYIRGNIEYRYLAGAAAKILRMPFVRDLAAQLLQVAKRDS